MNTARRHNDSFIVLILENIGNAIIFPEIRLRGHCTGLGEASLIKRALVGRQTSLI